MNITRKIITPMLDLIVDWDTVTGADSYEIRVLQYGAEDVTLYTATEAPYRVSDALRNATWYFVQVAALDASEEVLEASSVETVYTSAQTGAAPLLRQAVYNAILDSDIDGLCIIDDGYYRPRALGKVVAPNVSLPAVEVRQPVLQGTQASGSTTQVWTWAVPIVIKVADTRGDSDNLDSAWLLFEKVQRAIDQSDALKLNRFGVLPELWQWSAEIGTNERGNEDSILVGLTIPMYKQTGVILLPQPAELPEEPDTPEEL